jgi:TonB-dependent SusC/RagA subfamily outer membrane receptor
MHKLLRCLLVTAFIVPVSSVKSLSAPGQRPTAKQDSTRKDSLRSLIFNNTIPVNTANTPVNTPEQLFAGRVAGVQVMETNGGPGGEFAVTIRGVATLLGSAEPLYVIDGLPLELHNYGQAVQQSNIEARTFALNALSMIDPFEIESIQVLKDISATAIYGTRASNGVVLITTKKSHSNKLKVRLESAASVQKMTRNVEVLNSTDFLRYSRERLVDYPNEFSAAQYLTAAPESYEHVDWMKEVTRTGHILRNNLTISGGTGPLKVLVQGGLFKHNGIVRETNFDRKNAAVNLNANFWKNRIRLGTKLYYADAGGTQRSVRSVQTGIPIGPVYNPDGSLHEFDFGSFNPLRSVARTNVDSQHKRLLSTTHAEIGLLKNLSIRSSYGVSRSWNDYEPNGLPADSAFSGTSIYSAYFRNIKTYNVDARAHFFHTGKRIRFEVDAGYAQFTEFGYFGSAQGKRAAVLALLDQRKSARTSADLTNLPGVTQSQWTKGYRRMNSVFLNAKIGLGNAIEVLVSSRQDMNPVFKHTEFRQGNASSVGVGWQVNKPGKVLGKTFNSLKLHADFGYIAKSDLYSRISLGVSSGGDFFDKEVPYSLLGNAGFDASLFSDRLLLAVSYFNRQTLHNRMMGPVVAGSSGYVPTIPKVGRMSAHGLELSVGYEPVRATTWNWKLSGNAVLMSNKIKEGRTGAFPSDIGGSGKDGPVGAWYRYRNLGVWHSTQEISQEYKGAADRTPKPGDSRYTDDKEVAYAGAANPKVIWGLASEMTWKRWDFSLLFRAEHGQKVQNEMAKQLYDLRFAGNISTEVYENAWTPSHPERNFPAQTNGGGEIRNTDWFLQQASFVRLQNISFGYTYPLTAGERCVRVYLTGQNLFLLTPYKGWDPEVNKYGQNPHFRGVDDGIYPRARTFTLGIQFNL